MQLTVLSTLIGAFAILTGSSQGYHGSVHSPAILSAVVTSAYACGTSLIIPPALIGSAYACATGTPVIMTAAAGAVYACGTNAAAIAGIAGNQETSAQDFAPAVETNAESKAEYRHGCANAVKKTLPKNEEI